MILVELALVAILGFLILIGYELGRIALALEWLAEQNAEECECGDCEESHA